MKTRVISGLIMVPLLAVVVIGGYPLMVAAFLVGLMGVREFYSGFEAMGIRPSRKTAYVALVALYAVNLLSKTEMMGYFSYVLMKKETLVMLWFFGAVLLSLLYLFKINERKLEDGLATLTGIFYVIFFSYHVVLIDQLPYGYASAGFDLSGRGATGELPFDYSMFIWLVFITAFGTDIMAYFSGYFFGKHKLCPVISPKKTIEGAVGGTLGSMILCGVFGYFFMPDFLIHCLIIGLLGAVVSQFGDLTASIFKRKMGIKDYGNLIPGHGGIMDRFDSVLFTAPLVYYYVMLIFTFDSNNFSQFGF